jgi:hypothetical protein
MRVAAFHQAPLYQDERTRSGDSSNEHDSSPGTEQFSNHDDSSQSYLQVLH